MGNQDIPSIMSNSEKFCLRWNDFETNIRDSFRELREEQDYFDVTLACDDGPTLEAHRIILSAGSQLFRDIFRKSKHQSPFVYLKGISSVYLGSILDFLYNGEASIDQDELATFLETARELQVKGLQSKLEIISKNYQNLENKHGELDFPIDGNSISDLEKVENVGDKNQTMENKYEESDYPNSNILIAELELENIVNIVDATEELEYTFDSDLLKSDNEVALKKASYELDTQIEQMVGKKGTLWECRSCGKLSKQKVNLKKHIETHIVGILHSCHTCNKTCSTRNALQVHITDNHSSQLFDCNICGKFGMTKMSYKGHKSMYHKNTLKL